MPIQLATANIAQVGQIIAKTSATLTTAHMAYADGRLDAQHYADTVLARDQMGMLLADFEDGDFYGAIEPEWRMSMRHLECAASALISAVQFEDDVRPAVQPIHASS